MYDRINLMTASGIACTFVLDTNAIEIGHNDTRGIDGNVATLEPYDDGNRHERRRRAALERKRCAKRRRG